MTESRIDTPTDLQTDQTDPLTALPRGGPSRRVVLRAVAVSGAAAAVLAACGGGGDDAAETAESTPPGDDSAQESSPAEESSPADEKGGSGLVATADVPVGGGVILGQIKVVVTQPADGDFKAFTAVCTHMSCIVSSVKNDRISCACHGSAYSAKDGSVLNGPAPRPLKEIKVAVEGDQVVKA